MGGGAADERQKRVVPRLEAILDHRRHGMASLPIPDELLWEIFLRLPIPADQKKDMLVLPTKGTRTWLKIYLWSLQQIRQHDKMDIINGKHIYVGDI